MNEFREQVFDESDSQAEQRITLFRYRNIRWRWFLWPSPDWLCAVQRSGNFTRKRRRWFRVSERQVEGVSGRAWRDQLTVEIKDLPEIKGTSRETDVAAYAENVYVTSDWVRNQQFSRENAAPRSFCAFPVEVNGKTWGVIVIASTKPRMKDLSAINEAFKRTAFFLGILLKRL